MSKQLPRIDLDNGNRICNKCKEEKDLENFPKDKKCKLGRARTCKECTYRSRDSRRDKMSSKNKEWYQENKKRILLMRKDYYEENRKRLQAYGRQHVKDNPEIYSAARHRRRAAIRNNGKNDLTATQIKWMFDNFPQCSYCGSEDGLTIDHVVPISKGGQNTLSNVVPACMPCNNKKRAKDVVEFRKLRV